MSKKLISIFLFLFPVICFSQTINPGGAVTISCATCPACPSPVIIHDTVKTNTTLIIHDTVKINTTLIIHDSVCPSVPPIVIPPVNTGTRQNLILENTFEGSPFTGFTTANGQFCCSYSITQTAAPDGLGKALRYELRRTDPDVSGSKRAEIQLNGTDAPQESERWYGWSYWFDTYDVDNGGAESIVQWHDVDQTTPPLSIQVSGGRMNLTQSFIKTGNTHDDIGLVETKKWVKIVMHVKWTTGTTGIIQVWKDGKLVVNKSGVRTNSNGGSYFKGFLNKWSWQAGSLTSAISTPRIFYIDDFRYGNEKATFNDVTP